MIYFFFWKTSSIISIVTENLGRGFFIIDNLIDLYQPGYTV